MATTSVSSLSFVRATPSYINMSDIDIMKNKSAITCFIWAYPTALNTGYIDLVRDDGTYTPIQIPNNSGQIASVNFPVVVMLASNPNNTLNAWHFYSTHWDKSVNSGKPDFYANATNVQTAGTGSASNTASGSNPLMIGNNEGGHDEGFDGNLCFVLIYTTKLSQAQAQELLYNPWAFPTSTLVAFYWLLNTTSTISDQCPNTLHTGTATGTSLSANGPPFIFMQSGCL